jgi:hypothetical protein
MKSFIDVMDSYTERPLDLVLFIIIRKKYPYALFIFLRQSSVICDPDLEA